MTISFQTFSDQMVSVLPQAEREQITGYPQALTRRLSNIPTLMGQAAAFGRRSPVDELKVKKRISLIEKERDQERKALTEDCYAFYVNAYRAELPILLGGDNLRTSDRADELRNFGVLSTVTHCCPKGVLVDSMNTTTGSIFCDGSWSVVKNDAGMLGVVHSHKSCYVFGSDYEDQLWDRENSRPKVMGREVAALYHAGYRQVATDEQKQRYGPMFVCLDKERATRVTLFELFQASQKQVSEERLLGFFAFTPEEL